MDKKERASVVQEELMRLYENPPIPLTHHDPYTLLVAVLLSAQCTDKRVNLVTPALFALASTPEEMARQEENWRAFSLTHEPPMFPGMAELIRRQRLPPS